MTPLRAFRALRYDPAKVDYDRVLAPVYDVVAEHERAELHERDPHNAARLTLARTVAEERATDYAEVAERLRAWQREGVLARDAAPALYVLRQRYAGPDGGTLERVGFFGALRLEPYEGRRVRPHERTLAGPKADRMKILRATQANLSSVFLLYEDRGEKLADVLEQALEGGAAEAVRAVDDAGVENTLVPLRDAGAVEAVRSFLADRPLVIADGHHRYETALAYRDARRAEAGAEAPAEAPYDFVLAYLANAWAPGSLLLPIHRVVRRGPAPSEAAWAEALPGWERREIRVEDAARIPELLEAELAPLRERYAFAADDGSGRLWVFSRPAEEELSIRVIHREVLGGVFGLSDEDLREGAVAFPKSTRETARQVREGEGAVALYLNPLSPDDVFRVTEAGETLPQKSTYFHPKLPTGLLFRLLDAKDGTGTPSGSRMDGTGTPSGSRKDGAGTPSARGMDGAGEGAGA